MQRKYDVNGKIITRSIVNRSLTLSLIGGATATVWYLFVAPQQILTILIKNYLGASSTQLGIFLGILNFASVFHLLAVLIFSRRSTIKPVWMTINFITRSLTFVVAASLFYAAKGGSRTLVLYTILLSLVISFILGNSVGSGWWAWMNGIVPKQRRSSYFGKRSAAAQALNVIAFFSATLALDTYASNAFFVFGVIYTIAGILGLLEVVLHIFVPEAAGTITRKSHRSAAHYFAPIHDKNFRTFCILAGVSLLAVNIAAPFFIPMITDPAGIGAPVIWIGIMFALSQLIWVLVIPFWGTLMDRFGAKAVTMIGMLLPLTYIGYLFLTPDNYALLLPVVSLLGGLLAPALYEGLNQTMMSLLPDKERTTYSGWYWAMLGSISAIGTVIGGSLLDHVGSITVLVISSIGVMAITLLFFDTVKAGKDTKFSSMVSTAISPGVVKSYLNIPVLGKSTDKQRVERTLQSVRDKSSSIILDEITMRLDDADEDVREEAVRALGRIGSADAAGILIRSLSDEDSLVRSESARALGKMRRAEAVPSLVEALGSDDASLVEVAARALGRIDSPQSSEALLGLIRGNSPLKIKITSAAGLSERQEKISVLQEILELYTQTDNRIMHKQLAIAIANILGKPGEFYQYVTGVDTAREEAVERLFKQILKNLRRIPKGKRGIMDHVLTYSLPTAITAFEAEEYQQAFDVLGTILLQLIYRHIGDVDKEKKITGRELDELYRAAPNLYGGYVVMEWIQEHKSRSVNDLEVLLLLYVLKWYLRTNGASW